MDYFIPAWRAEDGTLINIRDMETSYIKKCIKKIYRSNGTWRYWYLPHFSNELRARKVQSIDPF